jgi:hypothetical protein
MLNVTKFIIFIVFIVVLTFGFSTQSFALQQVAGKLIADINPGESQTLQWGLISDNPSKTITVELIAEGEGSEFLSFPEKIDLQPNQVKFVDISVTIPLDYNKRNTFSPTILAIEKGETGGPTVINIQMKKVLTINISSEPPNIKEAVPLEVQKETVAELAKVTTPQTTETTQPLCGKGTIEKNGQCVPDVKATSQETKSKGGGCLITTATYGSELAPQVQQLRELRDNSLLQTESGTSFMNTFNYFYYSFSPTIADYERENPIFREMVKIAIAPMISSLSILNYVDMDSEISVLGYGISLIILNVGMYFVAPGVVIVGIKKKFNSN